MRTVSLALLAFAVCLTTAAAHAGTIEHHFREENTTQTTTSTTQTDIGSNMIVDDTALTAGKKYLILATAQAVETGGGGVRIAIWMGINPLVTADSRQFNASVGNRVNVGMFTVWTAVAGEDVSLKFSCYLTSTSCSVKYASLLMIQLSDDLSENTDWGYAEQLTSTSLTTTFRTTGASLTFTPPADDYLILSHASHTYDSTAVGTQSRINRVGVGVLSTATLESNSSNPWRASPMLAQCLNLTNASHQFREESASITSNAHTQGASRIFYLRLSKFKNYACQTATTDALQTTNYADSLATIAAFEPTVPSPVWILGSFLFDVNNTSRVVEYRVQVDDADQPSGQTSDNYQFAMWQSATTAQVPYHLSTRVSSMSAATHSVKLQGSTDSTTGTPNAIDINLLALTMELAASGGGGGAAGRSFFLDIGK